MNYNSDGYILNGNLTEIVEANITINGHQITGMSENFTIDGTIEFSGKESGSFSFNNIIIQFVINPQTGDIISVNVTGTVTFNNEDVTNQLLAELKTI